MKKSFKLIVLAMLLCVGFVFTGCGASQLDSQVKVDVGNEKDYVACTEQDNFMVAMESLEDSEGAEDSEETEEAKTQTIKFTISAKLEVVEGLINPESETPTEKVEVSLLANAMISMYEENDEDKISAAAKATLNMGEEKQVYELYLKDNYLYTNDGEEKLKIDASEMMGGESSMPEFDMSVITEPFMEAMQNIEQQKVLKKGSKSIYQLEIAEGQYLYIVINNNQISQVYAELKDFDISGLLATISPEMAMLGEMPLDLEVSLELSETEIQYPSFDEYEDPTAEEVA